MSDWSSDVCSSDLRCVPGDAVRVDEGSVVSMGDHWLTLRRG